MSLLLQITLFLAAALMIVPLAKRLGIAHGTRLFIYRHLTRPQCIQCRP